MASLPEDMLGGFHATQNTMITQDKSNLSQLQISQLFMNQHPTDTITCERVTNEFENTTGTLNLNASELPVGIHA